MGLREPVAERLKKALPLIAAVGFGLGLVFGTYLGAFRPRSPDAQHNIRLGIHSVTVYISGVDAALLYSLFGVMFACGAIWTALTQSPRH